MDLWVKAGQVATDLNNLSLAARCYQQGSQPSFSLIHTKHSLSLLACKLEPENPMYLWQRALIHQNMNDAGKASSAYQQLLQVPYPMSSCWGTVRDVLIVCRCCLQVMDRILWRFLKSWLRCVCVCAILYPPSSLSPFLPLPPPPSLSLPLPPSPSPPPPLPSSTTTTAMIQSVPLTSSTMLSTLT